MTILITGGAGFVGRHLASPLHAQGHEVVVLDVQGPSDGDPVVSGLDYRLGSVTDSELVDVMVRRAHMVIHLAGIAEPLKYGRDPLGTMEVNLQGSLNVARSCTRHRVPILFASTSEVYGFNPELPWNEESARLLGPVSEVRWCYSTAKAAVEHYLDASRRQGGLEYTVLRLFNVYGGGLKGRVIDIFIDCARRGLPLQVHGDGEQTRTFCYVDDAVDAIVRIVQGSAFSCQTFNIGNPEPTRIVDLARLVIELTASRSSLEFVPYDQIYDGFADVRHRQPDISRIRDRFGWMPRWSLRDGLRAMLAIQDTKAELCSRRDSALRPADARHPITQRTSLE